MASPEAILLNDQEGACEFIGASSQDPISIVPGHSSVRSQLVRSIIDARAMRRKFFDEQLFADPAWDMLLELYALDCEGHRISVSKLSVAAGVPCTTTLRWIDKLESESLVLRVPDPLDARRVWIELSPTGARTMRAYVEQIGQFGFAL